MSITVKITDKAMKELNENKIDGINITPNVEPVGEGDAIEKSKVKKVPDGDGEDASHVEDEVVNGGSSKGGRKTRRKTKGGKKSKRSNKSRNKRSKKTRGGKRRKSRR